jgi:ribonuclease P/MRP protein subunit RPP1
MKITDACVYPYPLGDSSVRRMALEAKELGFDSIVAADTPSGEFSGIDVLSGILIQQTAVRDIPSRIKRERNHQAVVSVQAGNNGFNRAVISLKGIHIIRGIQSADKTAFDHVAAKMAADNHIAIDLDMSPLISGRGITRQRAMQRYRDILVLERRFEFPLTISSHAHSILEMRAVREIVGICSLIDMEITDIEKAFSGVDTVTSSPAYAVKVI